MASFENNILISYAHLDNRGGWVDAFHTSLSNWFGVLGINARIWRDGKLRGGDVFSEEILDQLKRSALFDVDRLAQRDEIQLVLPDIIHKKRPYY